MAMSAIYDQHSTDIENFVNAFTALEKQVGALFAINGKVLGFDLFDYPATLQKLLPKLVRSYALDAIDNRVDKPSTPSTANAQELLQVATKASAKAFPAIGKGEDVRYLEADITGGGLIADGRLVHLSAFRRC